VISWLLAATGTVHFFLNSSSTGRGFPLYTRAIRLAHNREGMVRAAVRTLTLNVFSVPDPDIISFVSAPPACQYFSDVAHYLADQVQVRRWGAVGILGGGVYKEWDKCRRSRCESKCTSFADEHCTRLSNQDRLVYMSKWQPAHYLADQVLVSEAAGEGVKVWSSSRCCGRRFRCSCTLGAGGPGAACRTP
jgi:hypothetical protein